METFHDLIGSDPNTITWWQMVFRGTLIFFYTLLLVRVGGRRIFGRYTSFDIVLGVILGSIMSRALTANAPFFPTLAAATALVILHRVLAAMAYHSQWLGFLIKGRKVPLISNGEIQWDALRQTNLTERDLREAVRTSASTTDLAEIHEAYFERSGDVSVVPR